MLNKYTKTGDYGMSERNCKSIYIIIGISIKYINTGVFERNCKLLYL